VKDQHRPSAHQPTPTFGTLGEIEHSLASIRTERGLTLTSVSIATGVSAPHLSEIERGLRLPSFLETRRLETFYEGRIQHVVVPVIVIDF